MFNFLKKAFKKKESVEKVEEVSENYDTRLCAVCNYPIGESKKRYVQGKVLHKKCFKNKLKDVINGRY
jgi:formylmethanofuran dehydrogenase subunit E